MAKFGIKVEFDTMLPSAFTQQNFPNVAQAVQDVTLMANAMWKDFALGVSPLPDGTRIQARSGRYAESIHTKQIGPFSAETFSDSPYAHTLEEGGTRDLKKMLDTSLKVRVSKKGKRYLIIPFQWGTPGTSGFGQNVMPQSIYLTVRQNRDGPKNPKFLWSRTTDMTTRVSGTGAWDPKTRAPLEVPQRKYLWGDRLKADQIARAGVFGDIAKRMQGMVKFQSNRGGNKDTQYLTFRAMTEDSQGWIAVIKPRHVARAVADLMRPKAEEIIRRALIVDLGGNP